MLNDKQVMQAALEFARLQPVQWDAWLKQWEQEHAEPTETVTVKSEPESTVTVEETVVVPEPKKRKAVVKKVKATDS